MCVWFADCPNLNLSGLGKRCPPTYMADSRLVGLSVCTPVCRVVHAPGCLSVRQCACSNACCLNVCVLMKVLVCPPVWLLVCRAAWGSVCLDVDLSEGLAARLYGDLCMSVCASQRLSVGVLV